jgi:hypothetical protein
MRGRRCLFWATHAWVAARMLIVSSADRSRRFAVTPLGATLQSDSPDSVREWALFVGAPEMWAVGRAA